MTETAKQDGDLVERLREGPAKTRYSAAAKRKAAAERDLLEAAKVLAAATDELSNALKEWNRERKSAPLMHWTPAKSVMDRFRYLRAGYGIVREPGDKRPWRVQKGKGFLTDRLGRVVAFPSAESAAEHANELIETIGD